MATNAGSDGDALRARAIALRNDGWSNRAIRAELGISDWKLTRLFRGRVQPAHENLTNRAKPELRARARELREQGWSYDAIARELTVSKSSLSMWLSDLPKPEEPYPGPPPTGSSMTQAQWEDYCARPSAAYWWRAGREKDRERKTIKAEAAAEIGDLTERELLLVGAVLYWCEGSKSKPWRRDYRVTLVNSDPDLIRLYMRYLDLVGVGLDQLGFNLSIHESADIEGATEYWAAVVGVPPERFLKPFVKRHNPRTVRKDVGADHRGCLVVKVYRSTTLYHRIEGWARAVMKGTEAAIDDIWSNGEG